MNTLIIQLIIANTIFVELKSSIYIINDAIGALVAPANTDTRPNDATTAGEIPSITDNVAPRVATC